ncbi:MAG: 2Fe-2S iron-sulfur cluster binding domain-containing protein [Chloroflexaceae bacterium]|nr:2Fe-2S iron-sulfur cluster binding domain-containing protein [Chloroflexaceae bacterium]NJL34659.1 2Fe-2S iron-sulfur cluster binding domain-containing protein [Chloroflexaceae bacterium]NJO06724.1 2Fe-2S iron-sulfur cluster binding domain-containing protein [Chloroflexaceae bacterium]
MEATPILCELRVLVGAETQLLHVPVGSNLRRVLLDANLSPYVPITTFANCGGRGLCGTCGIRFEAGEPAPFHWHDRLAAHYGYPRLSCQISIDGPMTVRLLIDKVIWGKREPALRYPPRSADGEG